MILIIQQELAVQFTQNTTAEISATRCDTVGKTYKLLEKETTIDKLNIAAAKC